MILIMKQAKGHSFGWWLFGTRKLVHRGDDFMGEMRYDKRKSFLYVVVNNMQLACYCTLRLSAGECMLRSTVLCGGALTTERAPRTHWKRHSHAGLQGLQTTQEVDQSTKREGNKHSTFVLSQRYRHRSIVERMDRDTTRGDNSITAGKRCP